MVVTSLDSEGCAKAQELAKELGLIFSKDSPEDYYLFFEKERLLVKDPRQGNHFSISIDIKKELDLLKNQKISMKKDLLARAVGFKGQVGYKVFDGTLGMGKDALHLLHFGCHIVASEIDPVAFALVRNAKELASMALPFEILWGDTCEAIKSYSEPVDCLYLDPMFEDIKKKSAPKKAMAMLRSRNISSKSAAEVIDSALHKGIKRVVVKRPIKGKQLYGEPTMVIAGKLVRYDVYIR